MWDPHQILTKTAIQKKMEIDAFFSAIAIAFQSAYRAEIHQNNIFFIFFKIIFEISTSKWSKNTKTYLFKI